MSKLDDESATYWELIDWEEKGPFNMIDVQTCSFL
jgi:hypothetical protein